MRYVVKHKETGHFLRPTGEWTRFLSEAQQFPNGLSLSLHLENMTSAVQDDVEVLKLPVG